MQSRPSPFEGAKAQREVVYSATSLIFRVRVFLRKESISSNVKILLHVARRERLDLDMEARFFYASKEVASVEKVGEG